MKKFLTLTMVLMLVLCTFVSASAVTMPDGKSFGVTYTDPDGGEHAGDYIDGESQGANGEYGQAKNYDGTPGTFTGTLPDAPAATPAPAKTSAKKSSSSSKSMPKTGDTTMTAEMLLALSACCFIGSRVARKQRIGK